ncbi:Putative Rieske 2Fe-2S iron-sulfur protein [Gimesia panareensis]|uniref:Rieske 2Fe-2S iron-sulfur protein n=1 Tax=Gimesia panareensis TaxID=2527978 RepID=A0A518FT44_9PLAN|nr:MBL fold metallo-hydrolase [Gimesia panareensis]QDV19521.1 Putative Rieske 2Fe-2S iron-sulfur protein [Gimesia panareensis]
MGTTLHFLNHASVIIEYNDGQNQQMVMTDPWFQQPAFGSWLPNPPTAFHPALLASLSYDHPNFSFLISHGHDDHFDDQWLKLFNKDIRIFTANYDAPSVRNRLKALGFHNVVEVTPELSVHDLFRIRCFINTDVSNDDSLYTITTPDSCIVHANDLWYPLKDEAVSIIKEEIAAVPEGRSVYMSQSNSASGYPMTYPQIEDRSKILMEKVTKMTSQGLRNAKTVEAKYFLGYAGYSSIFVKGKEEYLDKAIFPSPQWMHSQFQPLIDELGVEMLDMLPGDRFDFSELQQSLWSKYSKDASIKNCTIDYYKQYDIIEQCDTYHLTESLDEPEMIEKLEGFLSGFNDFVLRYLERKEFEKTIVGKVFTVEVEGMDITRSVKIGEGLIETDDFNKKMRVTPEVMTAILNKQILFENTSTGYEANFFREPLETYNRDFIVYLTMYSYVYKKSKDRATSAA